MVQLPAVTVSPTNNTHFIKWKLTASRQPFTLICPYHQFLVYQTKEYCNITCPQKVSTIQIPICDFLLFLVYTKTCIQKIYAIPASCFIGNVAEPHPVTSE